MASFLTHTQHGPDAADLFGRRYHHLELLLPGCLHVIGHAASQKVCESNTHISSECHRKLFLRWCKDMVSVKDKFISLPLDKLELDRVLKSHSRCGFVGCTCSIDCIHVGWDKCPSQWRPLFVGKEGCSTIVHQVTCDNHHEIQAVSQGHPGARSNKTIVKLADAVAKMKSKNSWLGSASWIVKISSGLKQQLQLLPARYHHPAKSAGPAIWEALTLVCASKDWPRFAAI